MSELLLILLLLPLLGCLFVLTSNKNGRNAYHVSLFTLGTGVFMILRIFSVLNAQTDSLHLLHTFGWFENVNIPLLLSADFFSLLLLLGVYISFIIGLVGLPEDMRRDKTFFAVFLYFVWNMTGLLTAGDMILFYVFFAGMLLPLFLLIGGSGHIKKKTTLYAFFIFNFAGILILLTAILIGFG